MTPVRAQRRRVSSRSPGDCAGGAGDAVPLSMEATAETLPLGPGGKSASMASDSLLALIASIPLAFLHLAFGIGPSILCQRPADVVL